MKEDSRKEMSRVHRVSINAATNYLRFIVTMVITFFLIPFVIRQLGEDLYGLWTLSFSIIGFFALLDFGFGLGVVKWTGETRVSGDIEHRNHMLSTVFFIYLMIAAVAMALLIGFSFFFPRLFSIPDELSKPAVLVLIILGLRSLVIQFPLSLFKGVLFGEQHIPLINIIQMTGTVVYAGLAWFFLTTGGSLTSLAAANCIGFFIENLLYTILAFAKVKKLRISPRLVRKKYALEAVSFSVFSFITTIAGLVLFNTDALIIQLTMSLSFVGIYGVALKVAEYALMLTKQLVNVFTPLILELKEKQEHDSIRFLLLDVSKYILTTGAILTGTVVVFGSDLLLFWVGETFLTAYIPLILLVAALMITIPELVASSVLMLTGHHAFTAKVAVFSIAVNITVSLLLVGPLGLTGIALGTLFSTLVNSGILTLKKAADAYEFPFHRYLFKVFLPVLIPLPLLMAAGWLIRQATGVHSLLDLILKAIPGVVIYVVVFWVFFVDKGIKRKVYRRLPGRNGKKGGAVTTTGSCVSGHVEGGLKAQLCTWPVDDAFRADWDHFLNDLPCPYPFNRLDWIENVVSCYLADEGTEILPFRFVDEQGQTCAMGIFQRVLEQAFPGNRVVIRTIDNNAQRIVPLVSPSPEMTAMALKALVKWGGRRVDYFDLFKLDNHESYLQTVDSLLKQQQVEVSLTTFNTQPRFMLVDDWTTYLSRRTQGHRKRIRRYTRKLQEAYDDYQYIRLRSPAEFEAYGIDRAFSEIADIYFLNWDINSLPEGEQERLKALCGFYERIFRTWIPAGLCDLNLLKANGDLIAFDLNIAERGSVFMMVGTYHPDYASRSPGNAIFCEEVQDSFSRSEHVLEMGGEYLEYKNLWAKESVDSYHLRLYGGTLRSRIKRMLKRG